MFGCRALVHQVLQDTRGIGPFDPQLVADCARLVEHVAHAHLVAGTVERDRPVVLRCRERARDVACRARCRAVARADGVEHRARRLAHAPITDRTISEDRGDIACPTRSRHGDDGPEAHRRRVGGRCQRCGGRRDRLVVTGGNGGDVLGDDQRGGCGGDGSASAELGERLGECQVCVARCATRCTRVVQSGGAARGQRVLAVVINEKPDTQPLSITNGEIIPSDQE
jgi:hypothetical protein